MSLTVRAADTALYFFRLRGSIFFFAIGLLSCGRYCSEKQGSAAPGGEAVTLEAAARASERLRRSLRAHAQPQYRTDYKSAQTNLPLQLVDPNCRRFAIR